MSQLEHLFIRLGTTYTSFSVNHLLISFPPFFCFSYTYLEAFSLYVKGVDSSDGTRDANVFFQFVISLFILLLGGAFDLQTFSVMKLILTSTGTLFLLFFYRFSFLS